MRKKVSRILGLTIQEGKWEDAWKAADSLGRLNGATEHQILLELCKAVENLENEIPTKSS